jgi:hypothetical protein
LLYRHPNTIGASKIAARASNLACG